MRLINFLLSYFSLLKWNIKFFLKYWFDFDFRNAIKRNRKICNSHLNERCFIVGNGPSLSKMDLGILKNEYVFTVNTIYRNDEIFKTIKSNCHILVDPNFFKIKIEKINEMSKNIKKYNPDILLITEYFKNNKYNNFFKNHHYQIYSHRTNSANTKIDFCKNMAANRNVVHVAIYSAIYMGFKEIYLIGCDMTSFYENFAANAGKYESYHAYELTDEDKEKYNNVKATHDNTFMLHDYAITFDIFKKIKYYCDINKVRLINATDGGILDMFPRRNFNDIFLGI